MHIGGKYGNSFSIPKSVNDKKVSSVGTKDRIPAAKTNETGKDSKVQGKGSVSIPKNCY
jgi:hypothetical protein